MNDQDKQIIEETRGTGAYGNDFTAGQVYDLLDIINRLDAENEKLKADLDRAVDALVKS